MNAPVERRQGKRDELEAINKRLDEGDARMSLLEEAVKQNTELTEKVFTNTEGMVTLAEDLVSGTRVMCRIAIGVKFILKDVIDPYWKPVLIVFLSVYFVTHQFTFPAWLGRLAEMAGKLL